MTVHSASIRIKTRKEGDMTDITAEVAAAVSESGLSDGIAVVFCPGSTGAVSTVEYEPGLMKDIPKALDRIAPADAGYEHNKTWGCDNGRSHVKATLVGPSLTVPFKNKKLVLGTWQQIAFIEMDTKARNRELMIQIIGD